MFEIHVNADMPVMARPSIKPGIVISESGHHSQ